MSLRSRLHAAGAVISRFTDNLLDVVGVQDSVDVRLEPMSAAYRGQYAFCIQYVTNLAQAHALAPHVDNPQRKFSWTAGGTTASACLRAVHLRMRIWNSSSRSRKIW